MKNLNIAAYGQGSTMYPAQLTSNLGAIRTAGWNTIILGFLHIDESGNIWFSEKQIIKDGRYTTEREWAGWPEQLSQLLNKGQGSTVTQILAGVGGAGTGDFQHIRSIYEQNNRSFRNTQLEKNFYVFRDKFKGVITAIEMDDESTYDRFSFFAFCQMLASMDFGITFCPYAEQDFWVSSLKALNESRNDGPVKWWALQCYDGGKDNDPQDWANAIASAIPGFDTTGFILASDWSRFLCKSGRDSNDWYWDGDCPPTMHHKLRGFHHQEDVGGAFLWTLGSILTYAEDQKLKPDPAPCGNVGMSNYIEAIKTALAVGSDESAES